MRFPEKVDVLHRGLLPFRVWQYFERLKEYAKSDPARFIAAAGTLAHYVGDSSQPLHGSIFSDGIEDEAPDIPRLSSRKDTHGNKLPAYRGEGVHSAYETQMINMAARSGELFTRIRENLGNDHGMTLVRDGREAALATLTCMGDVAAILPPRTLIDVFEKSFAPGALPHTKALWSELQDETGKVMALGVRTLAMIWDAAWKAGGGTGNPGRIDQDVLRKHYEDPHFRAFRHDRRNRSGIGPFPAAKTTPMSERGSPYFRLASIRRRLRRSPFCGPSSPASRQTAGRTTRSSRRP